MLRTLQVICYASLVVAVGCTESYKPDVSTETGNPPVIDSGKIALVITRDEVHVQGEPGAVTPPQGVIEVKVLRNQELVRGPIEDDGSFDVEVDATLDDVFEVRAVNGDLRSMAVIVIRGGAMVGEGDGGVLSCEQKSDLARGTVLQAISGADRSCETVDDCILASPDSACFAGCGGDYLSAEGIASVEAVREALDDGFCADYEDGCELVIPPCIQPQPAECIAGKCSATGENMDPVDGGVPNDCSADICLTSELSWRITSAGDLPAFPATNTYTLNDCNTLSIVDEAGETCSNEVLRCDDGSAAASIEKILATLTSEDVITAMEEGGSHGPADFGLRGHFMSITIGDKTFMYRTCWDEGECAWPGLQALALMLIEIGSTGACMPGTATDCTSNFDIGDCDAAIPVWWHNPATGTCETRTYGGCGGNDNNYDSQAACEQACGVSGGECPPNRVTIEDTCLACGPTGGCSEMGDYCALLCSSDADCEGELNPIDGGATECDQAQGLCVGNAFCL